MLSSLYLSNIRSLVWPCPRVLAYLATLRGFWPVTYELFLLRISLFTTIGHPVDLLLRSYLFQLMCMVSYSHVHFVSLWFGGWFLWYICLKIYCLSNKPWPPRPLLETRIITTIWDSVLTSLFICLVVDWEAGHKINVFIIKCAFL